MAVTTQIEVDAFAHDASCTDGFVIAAPAPGSLCAVSPATVVPGSAERRDQRRGPEFYVSLNLGGGRIERVRLVTFSDRVWEGLRSGESVAVRAHLFRGNVDAFESASGIATTSDRPNARTSPAAALAALFLGAAALWIALRMAYGSKPAPVL